MRTENTAAELVDLDDLTVKECEPTESGGYAELSLGHSLRLHVTVAEDTVSVVLTKPGERQAAIVVEDSANWTLKQE